MRNPLLHLALPKHNHMPAGGFRRVVFLLVPCDISLELGLPELHVGLRHRSRLASLVPMPEATVHENDRVSLGDARCRGAPTI